MSTPSVFCPRPSARPLFWVAPGRRTCVLPGASWSGAICVAALLLASAPAHAAGTIAGTVKLDGPAPKLSPVKVSKDASVCGQQAPPEACVVGKSGGLKDVVVAIKGGKAAGKLAPSPRAVIDQNRCRYEPHVLAVTRGTSLQIGNSDAVLHNVHANLGKITVFNMAMPMKGEKRPVKLKKPGIIKLQCDAGHTWMSAFVHVFGHPFHAVTDARGAFKIEGVPAGKHTLELWHEGLNPEQPGVTKTITVDVKDGETAKVSAAMPVR